MIGDQVVQRELEKQEAQLMDLPTDHMVFQQAMERLP